MPARGLTYRDSLRCIFDHVVPMTSKEWKALVARGKRRLSNVHEAGRVRAAGLRIGKEYQREVRL